jgi:Skp family chaperone for outer membrane proteins
MKHPPPPHSPAFQIAVTLVATCVLVPAQALSEDNVFETRIAPIFERRCVSCHNDDDRQGQLSLQSAAGLRAGGESGPVIDADPAASLLLDYLIGDEPEMPKDAAPLSTSEVDSIRSWLASGAMWPESRRLEDTALADTNWWSLQPLVRPPLPKLTPADWSQVRTPIDVFVLARLREQGLAFSPRADRRTLIRRLHFDLLGLPPSPEDVERFLRDDSLTAYEDLVDRLLASSHYGERWARHWLDVVKYADTCGYDKDKLRPNAWPYRDYVIRSFNEDKPYWRFAQEQIAGDVLFPGSPDGILGLGFVAAGPWDFIGHVEVPESKIDGRVARHIDRDEMVTNTLNTFISTTIQCARCHNHKFDPFTQQHYYNLQAVFAAVDRAERPYDLDPQVEQRRHNLQRQVKELKAQQKSLEAEVKTAGGDQLAAIEQRIAKLRPLAALKDKQPAFGYHSQISPKPGSQKWVQVDLGKTQPIDEIVLHPCHDDFAGIGAGFGFPLRFRVEVSNDASFAGEKTVVLDRTQTDQANPGLSPVSADVDGVSARFIRVTATRLTERQNDYIFAVAELEVLDGVGKNMALRSKVSAHDSIEAPVRWSRSNLTDGIWAKGGDSAVAKRLAASLIARQRILDGINTPELIARRDKLSKQLKQASQALGKLPSGKMVYAATSQFQPQGNFKPTGGKPRMVHVLHRGDIQSPRQPAVPGTLPVVPGTPPQFELPEGHAEGDSRAALAKWITREDNPLTWRSIVNRIWHYHMGRGIVASPNDLGRMGQLPSHPALLDWLAIEFRDNGQSIKSLHRMIVTSTVYRQASSFGENADEASIAMIELARKLDAGNVNLWRMNRRRLEAEEIRDAVLAVSGSLRYQMGGPGFYLFKLERTAHSPHFEYHKFDPADTASHRRSIYRFIARSQPDPFMTTLDCADSSQSTPRRNETMTSLQALTLLNNQFNLTMAARFAERLGVESDSLDHQINLAMRRVVGRAPTPEELDGLRTYGAKYGLSNLCRLLFNLSEFVYID